jgi:hypothetical protein
MSFKAATGLLGSTECGQRVTKQNIEQLPAGSVVRNGDGSRIIHLHDNFWLVCSDTMHCYDNVERMKGYLDSKSTLCHIPCK